MGFIELLKKRHSVRKFKAEQITDAELHQILEAGQLAPSGHNEQRCHFVVLQKKEDIEGLQEQIMSSFAAMDVPDSSSSFYTPIIKSKEHAYPCMYNPPTFIIVANKRGAGNAMADSSLAMENMMLMAAELNVGTCWINQVRWLQDDPAMMEYLTKFGIPKEEVVCGCLSVGYSEQAPKPPVVIQGNRIDIIK